MSELSSAATGLNHALVCLQGLHEDLLRLERASRDLEHCYSDSPQLFEELLLCIRCDSPSGDRVREWTPPAAHRTPRREPIWSRARDANMTVRLGARRARLAVLDVLPHADDSSRPALAAWAAETVEVINDALAATFRGHGDDARPSALPMILAGVPEHAHEASIAVYKCLPRAAALLAIQQVLGQAPIAPNKSEVSRAPTAEPSKAKWPVVQRELRKHFRLGMPFSSERALARLLNASASTIKKAIDRCPDLRRWREHARASAIPRAVHASEIQHVIDQTSASQDPAELVLEDEVDFILERLVEEAPDYRERIDAMDREERQRLAAAFQSQCDEYEPPSVEPNVEGSRRVQQHARV